MRNAFPGTCYVCGEYVPTGYGFFERIPHNRRNGRKWRVKCVKCTDGRTVRDCHREVHTAQRRKASIEAKNEAEYQKWCEAQEKAYEADMKSLGEEVPDNG